MSVTTLAEQKAFFEREGYLILPGFFSADSIDYFQGVIEHVKQLRPFDAVLDDLENGERTVLGLMTPEQVARHRIKLYDLHLRVFPIRELALAEPIVPLLEALLGHAPACWNMFRAAICCRSTGSAMAVFMPSRARWRRGPKPCTAPWRKPV